MKVVICIHRIGPMHYARMIELGKFCTLYVIEFSGKDQTYAWDIVSGNVGFARVTLFPNHDSDTVGGGKLSSAVSAALDEIKPDVVVAGGWSDSGQLAASYWASLHGVPCVGYSDSNIWDESRVWWKEWIKSRIVRLWGSAIVGGSSHEEYLRQLKFCREKIAGAYNVIDNQHFLIESDRHRHGLGVWQAYDVVDNQHFSGGADEARSASPPHKAPYFLTVARFIPKKNLAGLIYSYADYRNHAGENAWPLVILGEGPLRKELEGIISKYCLEGSVILPGFVQYGSLPRWYAFAGVFILASSSEQWGNVVNEAMASGLPVLVSDRCGSAHSLVEDGRNGFQFDPNDGELLSKLMLEMTNGKIDLTSFGLRSREIIASFTPEAFARNLMSACTSALGASPGMSPSWYDRVLIWLLIRRPRFA